MSAETFRITNDYGSIDYYVNDEEMVKQRLGNVFFEQMYVDQWLTYTLVHSSFVLDIGAHCGSHTVMYKKINPDLVVHAFEPQSMMYNLLSSNVMLNNLDNVICHNKAVGHFCGTVQMNQRVADGQNTNDSVEYGTDKFYNLAGLEIGSGGESVEMVTVDDFNFDRVDFMKIDVEGYEPFVLEGAIETIKRSSPVISYESNSKSAEGVTRSSYDILTDLGYTCKNVWGDNWLAILH